MRELGQSNCSWSNIILQALKYFWQANKHDNNNEYGKWYDYDCISMIIAIIMIIIIIIITYQINLSLIADIKYSTTR